MEKLFILSNRMANGYVFCASNIFIILETKYREQMMRVGAGGACTLWTDKYVRVPHNNTLENDEFMGDKYNFLILARKFAPMPVPRIVIIEHSWVLINHIAKIIL